MAANMYRVGDYVYFETSSTAPYQIRRVEELCKTATGNVEAKVLCFYRRRDISSSLVLLADKHQNSRADDIADDVGTTAGGNGCGGPSKGEMSEKQRHQLKHRELFLSRQVETLPATHIRGKCNITLLNETESFIAYLNREDTFFYSLVYDPQQKTLLADKGEIRVGQAFQAEPTPLLTNGESDNRNLSKLEELQWTPTETCSEKQINQFLIISRSVGVFARALDCTSTIRQPSLHMSAAAASRDITLFHAMDVLHKCNYDMTTALANLVPSMGPILCRDEMEEWSASEANLFEEALGKYGKDFNDIRQDFLPWKSLKSIVEYYYMWKTTDRYVQQKRIKAAEAESKLKQVYIPSYNKPNAAQINDKANGIDSASDRACESCYTNHSNQWYMWGPSHMHCRLCSSCWTYWKKYGGLKMPTRLGATDIDNGSATVERSGQQVPIRAVKCTIANCGKEFRSKSHLTQHLATVHGLVVRAGSPSPVTKTRAAFCLVTTPLTRISRRTCQGILDINRAARRPFQLINIALIKQECQLRLPELMNKLRLLKAKKRVPMEKVSARLGIDVKMDKPSLLRRSIGSLDRKNQSQQLTSRNALPVQTVVAATVEPRTRPTDSSSVAPQSPSRKRPSEHVNGVDGPASKSAISSSVVLRQSGSVKQMQPKVRCSTVNRLNCSSSNGSAATTVATPSKLMLSWMDTPDDVCFVATPVAKKARREMTTRDLKRGARKPWYKIVVASTNSKASSNAVESKESSSVVVLE